MKRAIAVLLVILIPGIAQAQEGLGWGDIATSLNASSGGTGTSGTAFGLPGSDTASITWYTSFGTVPTAITLVFQGTNNTSGTWYTLDTSTNTAGEARALATTFRFVRARISSQTDGTTVTVSFIIKRGGGATGGSSAAGGGLTNAELRAAPVEVSGATGTATTDADDNTIASGQTNSNVNALMQWYDGTAWKRVNFGVAGTPSSQVVTVQGITSGTPVISTGNKGHDTAAPNSTFFGSVGFIANAATPTYTEGRAILGSTDLSGRLRVRGIDTPAANFSNPSHAVTTWALAGCWDGATWDPCPTSTGGAGASDANTTRVALAADINPCLDASQVIGIPISTATSGNVELVAISGSTIVYVCGWDVTSVADVSVQMISGTGTACATGETNKTGTYNLSAASGAGIRGINKPNGGAVQFKSAAGEAVCIELSAAVQVDGSLTYVQR